MDPRKAFLVVPLLQLKKRMLDRSLSAVDLERLVREGDWRAAGSGVFVVAHDHWQFAVKIGRCTLEVRTAPRR
ncbi:MAG: hypothetical protein KGJ23_11465 [Euryarchaeota archaeon]|nr:hypothetical protein [Euryarchaeota archaeon]MDE1837213.1 hypothetical protein [Euryarchaeota archaeon]MDE1881421.1 hypothetical protein [Euryarchaeota archaeon]MDE2045369.1 hypothetical protein [Thermoplasmata archaeon]